MKIRVIGGIAAAISFAVIGWVWWLDRTDAIRERRRLRDAARSAEEVAAAEWDNLVRWMGEE